MKKVVRKILACNLREAIAKSKPNLGINKTADLAGVSRSQLYDVLGSKKGASVDWIDHVSEVVKVEPWKLLKDFSAARQKKHEKEVAAIDNFKKKLQREEDRVRARLRTYVPRKQVQV